MIPQVEIFVDGACQGNPGPGGWGALLRYQGVEKEFSGAELSTTNNQMELTAAIQALKTLKRSCQVAIYTDSQYVKKGITEWIQAWQRKGWKNAEGKPVKNQVLWQQLLEATHGHTIEWHWVKGHSDHPENDRVDALARAAISRLLKDQQR